MSDFVSDVVLCVCVCLCVCVQVDSQESSRKQKRAEILENLQRLYPGVVSSAEQPRALHISLVLLSLGSTGLSLHCVNRYTGGEIRCAHVPHVVECVSVSMWPGTRWPSQRCWGATWMPWWWTLKRLAKTASSTSRSRYVCITSCRKSSVKA